MGKTLSIVLLGLLAAVGSAAPLCLNSASPSQEVFGGIHGNGIRVYHPLDSVVDDQKKKGPVIYLSPNRARMPVDLNNEMQKIIDKEMDIKVNSVKYTDSLQDSICNNPPDGFRYYHCKVDVLSKPTIEVIPVRQLSDDILCSTGTCTAGLHETVSISTTHSIEAGISIEASAAPFGMGVTFTTSLSYGLSETTEKSTTLSYEFDLARGEAGFIGIVNAQISAIVRVRACKCPDGVACSYFCGMSTDYEVDEVRHHQAVILQSGEPKGI
ncbi:hypothetical protein BGX23_004169, partial [Mortierella sp. AD031]